MQQASSKYIVRRVAVWRDGDEEHCQSFPIGVTLEERRQLYEYKREPDTECFAVYEKVADGEGRVLEQWVKDFASLGQALAHMDRLEWQERQASRP